MTFTVHFSFLDLIGQCFSITMTVFKILNFKLVLKYINLYIHVFIQIYIFLPSFF